MPKLLITNCTVEDATEMAHNNIPAFWQDQNWRYPWVNFGLENLIKATVDRYPRNQLLKNRDTLRHFKAVDPETGKLIGYIRWQLPANRCKNEDGHPVWPEGQVPDVSPEDREAFNKKAAAAEWKPQDFGDDDHFDDVFARRRDVLVAEREYIILDYLAVHPDNQGKGIGSALVKHGIQKARELGIDVFVLAFASGFKVYTNAGFDVLETFDQDATKVGGTEHYIVRLMELRVKKD
ncbi:acyl-CoA N-acyltransferase [Cryphonectria parasitica EP155]|uniref:Acyl-CoA N-acyltransferase n=1 Tax=Cryphonectria parasitica (strain ATCC 38755 / EP155) TaxID=660469 RepID=A0A9P5CLG2_CRYP1|nr:acyl-CoA N-acyltransferase [Cryphonectria parasitica EP155]KAF3763309.1 acyl-CoA N-acyltransferase [Cryphonectria parasitica EP155]